MVGAPAARADPTRRRHFDEHQSQRLQDPELSARFRDEQQAISTRLAAAGRPLNAVWTGTHLLSAVAYLAIAQQAAASFRYWVVQTIVPQALPCSACWASVLRRLLQRWMLRHL
jgi:hypothetical protein